MTRIKSLLVVLTCTSLIHGYSEDWVQWRGPQNNNVSNETNVNPKALSPGKKPLWQTNVGYGHSSVVVKNDDLITMGSIEEETEDDFHTYDVVTCLNTASGEQKWQYTYSCEEIHFPGPRSTPAIDKGQVYTVSWNGLVHCLSRVDGHLIWKRDLTENDFAIPDHWGMCGSPIIVGDALILAAGKSGAALDKTTGQIIWRGEHGDTSLPSPAVFNVNGEKMLTLAHGSRLQGIDLKDGSIQWSLPWEEAFYLAPFPMDDPRDGAMFLPKTHGSALISLDEPQPKVLKTYDNLNLSQFLSFVILKDRLFGFSSSNRQSLFCYSLGQSEYIWKKRVPPYGSMTAADGILIVMEGNGRLAFVDPVADSYHEWSSCQALVLKGNQSLSIPERNYCWTSPVLADGQLYVRDNHGQLACFKVLEHSP